MKSNRGDWKIILKPTKNQCTAVSMWKELCEKKEMYKEEYRTILLSETFCWGAKNK